MGTEVLRENQPIASYSPVSVVPTSFDRPFKIIVQTETFTIDSESMSKMSPVFSIMCYGKDFEGGRELSREIVDELSADVDVFLRAVHDASVINASNFATVLRLSNKYQVLPVIEYCQNYILRQDLDVLKADEVLTLLIAAHEFHCNRDVVVKLILRLAAEGNSVFTRLKISRFLPAQIYGSVISTSMNINQLKECEAMNGHNLKMERSKTRWRSSVCNECKSVCSQTASCDECHKTLCKRHIDSMACSSSFGLKAVAQLKKNIVELDWE